MEKTLRGAGRRSLSMGSSVIWGPGTHVHSEKAASALAKSPSAQLAFGSGFAASSPRRGRPQESCADFHRTSGKPRPLVVRPAEPVEALPLV